MAEPLPTPDPPALPRVTIQYCTQCKWMLRAAYFGQELLSTFSTSLGEVALQPATGGVFRVTITTVAADQLATTSAEPTATAVATASASASTSAGARVEESEATAAAGSAVPTANERRDVKLLWDRKAEGGFPEVKELKRRVRDIIDLQRALGHVDRGATRVQAEKEAADSGSGSGSGSKEGGGTGDTAGLRAGIEDEKGKAEEKKVKVKKEEEETSQADRVPPSPLGKGEQRDADTKRNGGEICEDC